MPTPSRWTLLQRLRRRGWALKRMARALRLFVPMTRDVLLRRYRPVPWMAFGWMLAALVYLVSPLDLVPDVIVLLGLIDDVVVVGWLLNRVDLSLTDYRAWRGDESEDEDVPTASR